MKKTPVTIQLQGLKVMLKSALANKPLDPNLNVNLGCNLKWKPEDYQEEYFFTPEILRGRSRQQIL